MGRGAGHGAAQSSRHTGGIRRQSCDVVSPLAIAHGTTLPLAQVRRQSPAPCRVAATPGDGPRRHTFVPRSRCPRAPLCRLTRGCRHGGKPTAALRAAGTRHEHGPRTGNRRDRGPATLPGSAVENGHRDRQPDTRVTPHPYQRPLINKKIISKQQLGRYHNTFTSCILWRPEHRKDIKRTCMGISDELWRRVEPLIPPRLRTEDKPYLRRQGGGRKSRNQRAVFDAVLHVLRTRCAWHALPSELGNVSTTHRHFKHWEKSGFFDALWSSGLAEHPELHGLHWQCEPRSSGSVRWRPVSGGSRGRPRKSARDSVHRPHAREETAPPAGLNSTSGELIGALQWFISRRR